MRLTRRRRASNSGRQPTNSLGTNAWRHQMMKRIREWQPVGCSKGKPLGLGLVPSFMWLPSQSRAHNVEACTQASQAVCVPWFGCAVQRLPYTAFWLKEALFQEPVFCLRVRPLLGLCTSRRLPHDTATSPRLRTSRHYPRRLRTWGRHRCFCGTSM